ncbi:DUF397 domain-containing protein [Actinomadura latina]|uniref:DUF397 domain-containing protein n=1 Tax=Actinomadura latina TaxID=163603 RepID=A0A846YW84_9ACTN|nr:DUF397 domain-containing protein [Actinomadura latina]NKZ02942.1 DUF397 domain-containing protein [Actinomadura latina]
MTEPAWRKASRSSTTGGDCVEVASLNIAIAVRDSKDPGAGHLTLSAESFAQIISAVKRGELHL